MTRTWNERRVVWGFLKEEATGYGNKAYKMKKTKKSQRTQILLLGYLEKVDNRKQGNWEGGLFPKKNMHF